MKSAKVERTYTSSMKVLLFGMITKLMTMKLNLIQMIMKPETGLLTRKKKVFNLSKPFIEYTNVLKKSPGKATPSILILIS